VGNAKIRAVIFGASVHLVRFGIIFVGSTVAPYLGMTGWYSGLFVNLLCAAFAIALVTRYRLWGRSGFLTPWRGPAALAFLSLLVLEALIRLAPSGLSDTPPGFGLWALTLLLVGFNEELVSRVVVLERLSRSFSALPAVAITASLFGLQHLSAFATSNRAADDILLNVLASACYGFALAAYQYRFAWIWPLIIVHAMADFTTILTATPDTGEVLAIVTSVAFVAWGAATLRGSRLRRASQPADRRGPSTLTSGGTSCEGDE